MPARALGLLNAAMYDAVIAACDAKLAFPRALPHDRDARIASLAAPDDISSYASVDAAIAAAARTILSAIFPGDAETFSAAADEVEQVRMWTGMNTRSDIAAGEAIGKAVGALAVQRAQTDSETAIFSGSDPNLPGELGRGEALREYPPRRAPRRHLEAVAAASQGPISAATAARLQVPRVAARSGRCRVRSAGPDRRAVPDCSFLGGRRRHGHGARALAPIRNRADRAGASCHGAGRADARLPRDRRSRRLHCLLGREVRLLVRSAERSHHGFAPQVIPRNVPSYTSDYATVAGAASTVLADLFPMDAGDLRTMAAEAAISQLYGGLQWPADIDEGLREGRQIGSLAVSRLSADGL